MKQTYPAVLYRQNGRVTYYKILLYSTAGIGMTHKHIGKNIRFYRNATDSLPRGNYMVNAMKWAENAFISVKYADCTEILI